MNIGIVGIQGFGSSYLKTIARRSDARVIALCDLDLEKVDKLADEFKVRSRFTDFSKMLELDGLDAVFIATPHFLHHPMVMQALAGGKHVFCEKPLAITTEHAEEMAQVAHERNLVLTCHYNQRQSYYVKALRQIVQRNMIGNVYHINARWMARWTGFMFDARTNWRLQVAKSGGGILIGRGSHLLDSIRYILDNRPIHSVRASTHNHLTGTEVDDFATMSVNFKDGVKAHIQCSYVAHIPLFSDRMEYEIYGSDGGAAFGPDRDNKEQLKVGRCKLADGSWEDLTGQLDFDEIRAERPQSIVDDFIDAVTKGIDPLVTGDEAAYITRVLTAAYESSRTDREVLL